MKSRLVAPLLLATMIPLAWSFAQESPAKPSAIKIEVKWAEAAHQPDVTEKEGVDLSCSTSKAYLHKAPIVDRKDIRSASMVAAGGENYLITLKLTEQGASKLGETWSKHQEKPLVILIDGKIVAAMVPKTKLTDLVPVLGSFTKAEATRIVLGLSKE